MRPAPLILLGAIFVYLSPFSEIPPSRNSQEVLTDVDGNTYKTVKIGDQVWMAENLRVTRDRAGKALGSYCFDDKEVNCRKFGRLYTWEAAKQAVPEGWHLPSDSEWKELVDYLGGARIAGKKLLAGGSTGFEALLAGGADFRGNYLYFQEYALFWSSTEVNEERAYHQDVGRNGTSNHFAANKGARVSVRCLKNDVTSYLFWRQNRKRSLEARRFAIR